jgi:transposase
LPGRSFSCPADFNSQLQQWLTRANTRQHRVLGCRPADRLEADRAAMLALPPVAPVVGWRSSQRLARDHYVRLDANDYSVHPSAIGRRVEITADLHRVGVFCDGRLVADHKRLWAKHQTILDPEHLAAAKTMRRQRLEAVRPPADTEVETRCLSDYLTPCSASMAGWRDDHQHPHHDQTRTPRPQRGNRVFDPHTPSTDPAPVRRTTRPASPG